MTPRLQICQSVITKLSDVRNQKEGAVYGTMYDNSLLVLGISVSPPEKGAASFHKLQTHFPTKIDFSGVVVFTDKTDNVHLSSKTLDILKEVLVTDNPLVMKRAVNSSTLKAYFFCNEKLVEVEYQVLSETDICSKFIHVRLQTQLPLVCDPEPSSILEAVNALQKRVSSGTVAFHLIKSQTYLFGTEPEETSMSVNELFNSTRTPDRKRKTRNNMDPMEVLDVRMMQKATLDPLSEEEVRMAPVIHHFNCEKHVINAQLPINHLALVHRESKVAELYTVLVDTLCRSLRVFERCLSEGAMETHNKRYSLPRSFHFLAPTLNHFLTIVYQNHKDCDDLEDYRETFHTQFDLTLDRPFFRRGNNYIFRNDIPADAPLVNPHEGLNSQVKGGQVHLVFGQYEYYHYNLCNFDDDGWGCAYRSLQTLVSWFRLQGYTDKAIPTHRQIQEKLADIGDKPRSFVGSRQWIGSMEVNFCLETMYGFISRILNIKSGADLAEMGPELAQHFDTQGTPIMIGGGVLAHTIVGVDLNRDTGEVRFLVADPHYKNPGPDDLRTVQQKGMISWKKPEFWNKEAFYNICLPIRLSCF